MATRLGAACGSCGAQVRAVSSYCHRCGYGLSPVPVTSAAPAVPARTPAPRSSVVDVQEQTLRSGRMALADLMAEITAGEDYGAELAPSPAVPATAHMTAHTTAQVTAEATALTPAVEAETAAWPAPPALPERAPDPQETVFGLLGELAVEEEEPASAPRGRRRVLTLVAAGLAVLVGLGVVAAVVLRPSGSSARSHPRPAPAAAAAAATTSWDRGATVQVPATSPDARDAAGHPTSYAAAQMLDGDPTTAWRMDHDGAGAVLTFTLDAVRPIRSLGLVNGYAKVDPTSGTDRYAQQRRITHVTWIIDGHEHPQALQDGEHSVQRVAIPVVSTRQVQLRIDATTAPGDRHFDMTAISDVAISG